MRVYSVPGSLHPAGIFRNNRGDFRMSIGKEFREFAMKGNVVDLAVGVVIGAAFARS